MQIKNKDTKTYSFDEIYWELGGADVSVKNIDIDGDGKKEKISIKTQHVFTGGQSLFFKIVINDIREKST